jgi:ribosomal protein S25
VTDTDTTTAEPDDPSRALRDRVADYVREHGPVTFSELADALDVNRQQARVRLREAVSDGRVQRAGSRRGRTLWAAATAGPTQPAQGRVDGVTATAPPDTAAQSPAPDLDDVDDAGDRDDAVLAEIRRHPDGVTTSQVAEALSTESDKAYNSIRRLREAGQIEKRQDPNDKRTSLWTAASE